MTDWLSAGGMILSGLIVGFMFWYGMKSRAPKPDVERLDLEAKRDALLQQLRELKETGGSAEEQRRLERETADVLRALDQRKRPGSAGVPPAVEQDIAKYSGRDARAPSAADVNIAALTRAASIRGFIWGAASVAILGGIAWFVTQQTTPRTESVSPMASAPQTQQQPPDAALQQIEAAVAKSPDNLEMRNQLAKAYL